MKVEQLEADIPIESGATMHETENSAVKDIEPTTLIASLHSIDGRMNMKEQLTNFKSFYIINARLFLNCRQYYD